MEPAVCVTALIVYDLGAVAPLCSSNCASRSVLQKFIYKIPVEK